jgi:hypothetical protein
MCVTQDLNSFGEIIAHISFLKRINIMPGLGEEIFPWKFNLEYGSTFTKLFMHVSSRNMFPTIRNLQIRVHVYRPRHCCGDWLTFGCFVQKKYTTKIFTFQTRCEEREMQHTDLHNTYLNLPIRRRCENISPPVTNSNIMYKFELSWNLSKHWIHSNIIKSCFQTFHNKM